MAWFAARPRGSYKRGGSGDAVGIVFVGIHYPALNGSIEHISMDSVPGEVVFVLLVRKVACGQKPREGSRLLGIPSLCGTGLRRAG